MNVGYWQSQFKVKDQGGTDRQFDAIHIYDRDNQVIAVFKKATGQFTSTCRLTLKEENELLRTENSYD